MSALDERGESERLLWLNDGLSEFVSGELGFKGLANFRDRFADKLGSKTEYLAFESTEGRLGGELHDFVIELVMTTIQTDKKAMQLENFSELTEDETENIKLAIEQMREKRLAAAADFLNSLR
jgi:DNA-binding MurR/RpiR family transcriptional regulator